MGATIIERVSAAGGKSASLWARVRGGTGLVLRHGVTLQAEMIAGAAVDYATRRMLQEHTSLPTDQTIGQWLAQGAAMAVGRHLSHNVAKMRSHSNTSRPPRGIAATHWSGVRASLAC